MRINILAFGVVKEIFQQENIFVELNDHATVHEVKTVLEKKYPALKRLGSYMIAVDQEYARDEQMKLSQSNEIAIIPPVSGG